MTIEISRTLVEKLLTNTWAAYYNSSDKEAMALFQRDIEEVKKLLFEQDHFKEVK